MDAYTQPIDYIKTKAGEVLVPAHQQDTDEIRSEGAGENQPNRTQ